MGLDCAKQKGRSPSLRVRRENSLPDCFLILPTPEYFCRGEGEKMLLPLLFAKYPAGGSF